MKHPNLIRKYNKAQHSYAKGNYRKAKMLFWEIVIEITGSDTDSMADIDLANSAQDYLDEIEHSSFQNKSSNGVNKRYVIIFILLVLLSIFSILLFR